MGRRQAREGRGVVGRACPTRAPQATAPLLAPPLRRLSRSLPTSPRLRARPRQRAAHPKPKAHPSAAAAKPLHVGVSEAQTRPPCILSPAAARRAVTGCGLARRSAHAPVATGWS
eukprot:scaffold5832_cov109-Isochrysis_galbana.AAC.1